MKLVQQGVREQGHSDAAIVAQGNTEFALDLYRELRTSKGNLFFSPYSLSTALAMTYASARENTERQMAQTLHFTLDQKQLHPAFAALTEELKTVQEKGHILLRIANALWPQAGYPLLEDFLDLAKEYYGTLITSVDYGAPETARQQINAWVEEKTQEKIRELILPGILSPLTRLVLVNAIYFKGNWASQFDRNLTQAAPFWVGPSEKVEVPMMTQKRAFKYGEGASWQILELPYVGNDLAMIVLLPKKVDGLAQLEEALTVENLAKWLSHLQETEVEVYLPRFKLSWGFRADGALVSMGMRDAFDPSTANFSGMDGNENWLYIGAVLHKAFVDVNEEGTEAAAATAVVMLAKGLPALLPIFRADHPFVFLIRENRTGSILFFGRVTDPTQGTD